MSALRLLCRGCCAVPKEGHCRGDIKENFPSRNAGRSERGDPSSFPGKAAQLTLDIQPGYELDTQASD